MDEAVFDRKILLLERLQEELDAQIDQVFDAYCQVYGIHHAYGVEKWEDRGKHIWILQDTSAMGCYNSESHLIPKEIAHLRGDELFTAMKDHKNGIDRAARAALQEKAHQEHINNISQTLALANEES